MLGEAKLLELDASNGAGMNPRSQNSVSLFAGALVFSALVVGLPSPPPRMTVTTGGPGASAGSSCDADGVDTRFDTTFSDGRGYTVRSVTVTGLDTLRCAGTTLTVSFTDAGGASLGGGAAEVPAQGSAMTVAIPSDPPAESVETIAVTIGARP